MENQTPDPTTLLRAKILRKKLEKQARLLRPFRISLRYKLALPVLILVTLMLLLLFRTTFRTVRSVFLERHEQKLLAITEIFVETIKVPLILNNPEVLQANIEWMVKRPDVFEVRVENQVGMIVSEDEKPTYHIEAADVVEKQFFGVRRVSADTYIVGVAIREGGKIFGRVLITFGHQDLESELRRIFVERLMLAFLLAFCLAILTSVMTWLALRPLFILKRTTEKILTGDLTARARIFSFDEIEDLAEAFNEMVTRLGASLDNLRTRTEALEESEQRYRLMIENASDIIFTLTPDGEMALLNKDISGCPREELLLSGLPLLLDLHDKDSRIRFEEALFKLCDNKEPITNLLTKHIHRISQQEVYYLVNLNAMLDYQGHLKLIQGVMRDVTEMRRIDMMKDSLIRDVAHELKTPTAKFQMAVEWFEREMLKHQEQEKYKQVLDILKNNSDRLMRIITSIMDLTKLESGMDKIEAVSIDLREVLEQVYQDMEPLCRQKNLVLEKHLPFTPLNMKGDRDMLYRVFVNLISNAIKFTEKGKIQLKAYADDSWVTVVVEDSGIGIEKEDLEKIFDRFYQKTAATVGIGVGLTISRDIAALHQGRIWAESKGPGKGTRFTVEFPRA